MERHAVAAAPQVDDGDARIGAEVAAQVADEDVEAGVAEKISVLPKLVAKTLVFHDFIEIEDQQLQHAALTE